MLVMLQIVTFLAEVQGTDHHNGEPFPVLTLQQSQVRPIPIDDSLARPLSSRHIGRTSGHMRYVDAVSTSIAMHCQTI